LAILEAAEPSTDEAVTHDPWDELRILLPAAEKEKWASSLRKLTH
jgi:hypothetical protein